MADPNNPYNPYPPHNPNQPYPPPESNQPYPPYPPYPPHNPSGDQVRWDHCPCTNFLLMSLHALCVFRIACYLIHFDHVEVLSRQAIP
jgi:hypothetical protein